MLMYLLISWPLQQTISGLQGQICSLEEDVGESETCQVGGSEGSITFHTFPAIKFNLQQFLHFIIGLPGGLVERRRGLLQGRHLLNQVVDAGGKLGVERYCCGRDLCKVNMNRSIFKSLNLCVPDPKHCWSPSRRRQELSLRCQP